jgi:outer membrane receptor protein involved in Fe transport
LPQQYISELSVNGFFLQETFGWDEQLYLTLAGRIDGSSAFSSDNQLNFYPKASMSWVASRLFQSTLFSTLKFRASFGQAGNLTGVGPYDRFNNFAGTLLTGLPAVTPPRALNNPDVKPEVMSETEGGADLAFLRNRIGLSFTVYNQDIDNLLFNRAIPPSIGGTSLVTNVGKMNNKGVEVMLQAQAVRSSNFSWDIGLNFSPTATKCRASTAYSPCAAATAPSRPSMANLLVFSSAVTTPAMTTAPCCLPRKGLSQPERGLVILESQFNEGQPAHGSAHRSNLPVRRQCICAHARCQRPAPDHRHTGTSQSTRQPLSRLDRLSSALP